MDECEMEFGYLKQYTTALPALRAGGHGLVKPANATTALLRGSPDAMPEEGDLLPWQEA